ncbi:hypothetical protein MHYP_G00348620 [Metynnis hypsauchen]
MLSVGVECRDTVILILQLLILLTLLLRTDGYYMYWTNECITSSSDLSDMEYFNTKYFNKQPVVRFNSTVGEFVGFTELGAQNAERWNRGPDLERLRSMLDMYCKPNLQLDHTYILDKAVKSRIEIMSQHQGSGGHPAMLMCSAYDFYPPAIDVYWLRDGEKVTGDVTSVEEMADGDWYYQIHSHLEYTPSSGEKISCVVEHASSKKPIKDFAVSLL